jgi:hypothetical protein
MKTCWWFVLYMICIFCDFVSKWTKCLKHMTRTSRSFQIQNANLLHAMNLNSPILGNKLNPTMQCRQPILWINQRERIKRILKILVFTLLWYHPPPRIPPRLSIGTRGILWINQCRDWANSKYLQCSVGHMGERTPWDRSHCPLNFS